jgi:hypothetical protein
MSDIRKRTGKKGTTYQVRYASTAAKSGYAYATFDTLKEAREFIESGRAQHQGDQRSRDALITVPDAIDRWLSICKREGLHGKDPVTKAVLENYQPRGGSSSAGSLPFRRRFLDCLSR